MKKEKKMTVNREAFLKLFRIGSGSGREQGMIDYIESFLKTNKIVYQKDENGNIFNFSYKDCPFVSAHMDTVQTEEDEEAVDLIEIYDNNVIAGEGIIGGDDKCGIYICLELLKKYKGRLNFSFSVEEEIGGERGASFIASENASAIKDTSYGLVFDRRGNEDIICHQNRYGSKRFEDRLAEIGREFGYKPERGMASDADKFRRYVSCANIASGYYKAHSPFEYVVISDVENALNYGDRIISILKEKFYPSRRRRLQC